MPRFSMAAGASTIRSARATVAEDLAKSRLKMRDLSAQLRGAATEHARLMVIADAVGVTEVDVGTSAGIIDAGVSAGGDPPQLKNGSAAG
ncbi:MAG: hypothetical protein U9Q74_13815 [Gemmatimonadota bacterium]|nr:hypothetical protein [Gemmatimonadota bacterium]